MLLNEFFNDIGFISTITLARSTPCGPPGKLGESYNIGGDGQRSNLAVVTAIYALLDELLSDSPHRPHRDLVTFVADRPGHDRRYAIDWSKLRRELNWAPQESLESGLRKTVLWCLDNGWWWEPIWSQRYRGACLGIGRRAAEP